MTYIYKDIDISFSKHPVSGELLVKKDYDSIRQAVKTLVRTNLSERYEGRHKGSNATSYLFSIITPALLYTIKSGVEEVLNNYEPRITVKEVTATFDYSISQLRIEVVYIAKINENQDSVIILL